MYDDELDDDELEKISGGQSNYIELLRQQVEQWERNLKNASSEYEKQYAYKKIAEINNLINESAIYNERGRSR